MATNHIDLKKVLAKRGYAAERERLRQEEQSSRDARAKRILGTDTIRDRDIDAARLLMTTLGGLPRAITLQDLEAFSDNARKLGKRYKGGITAKGVIDHSLKVDRERANREIRTAVAVKAQAGMMHFITNAGPESDVSRHHVNVEFTNFKSHAASPIKADKQARAMLDGPMKFECDCGRFRFWYRFVATKGGFCAGRLETGYPRIRNPKLVGVACKHALRVMQAVLKDGSVRLQATKMIAAAQSNDTRAHTLTTADARAEAKRQLDQQHHIKHQVETSKERVLRQAKAPGAAARAAAKALVDATRKAQAKMQADILRTRKAMETEFKRMEAKLATMKMTKAMRDQALKKALATVEALKKMQTID